MFEFYIARRIALEGKKTFSRFIVRIAIAAIALSLSIMIIALATVNGFQNQISNKIFGFWGHIHIKDYSATNSYEEKPVSIHQPFYPSLDTLKGIDRIQVYAFKAGIIKTGDNIEGMILKGIGSDFDWGFFKKYIVEGENFEITDSVPSNKILISKTTANRLHLKIGNPVEIHFIQQPPRARKFTISGIYNTGLEEYDKMYALVDISHIQKLNDWTKEQVGGFEVSIDDIKKIDEQADFLYSNVIGEYLYAQTIKEMNPGIFDWLDFQTLNERVILILMVVVAGINMITALLILILERTNMIGLLKALGANNFSIRKIFLLNAAYIISIGLLLGNIFGIGLCWLQYHFHFIQLNEENYYLSTVPIELNFWSITVLNLGTLIITFLMLVIPSMLVSRISPIKAIRWQ